MRTEVESIFNAWIADTFKVKEDIRKFLLNHPRKQACLDNLCEQILTCERRLYRITFDATVYRQTIKDIARLFCDQALEAQRQAMMSDNEKTRFRAEKERDQYVDEAIAEMKKDGLIIDNDPTLKEHADNGEEVQEEVRRQPGIII